MYLLKEIRGEKEGNMSLIEVQCLRPYIIVKEIVIIVYTVYI